MRTMNSTTATYTPPFSRRSMSAGRGGASGQGNVTGTVVGFHGPSSLPNPASSMALAEAAAAASSSHHQHHHPQYHMMRGAAGGSQQQPRSPYDQLMIDSSEQPVVSRRSKRDLNRMRAHRSLDASELAEYDPLLQSIADAGGGGGQQSTAAPPADPAANHADMMGVGGGGGLLFPYAGGGFSLSQGNLLHLSSAPHGGAMGAAGPFSNAPYGQAAAGPAGGGGGFAIMSSQGINPYAAYHQHYLQHHQQPPPPSQPPSHSYGGGPGNPNAPPQPLYLTRGDGGGSAADPFGAPPLPLLQREYELLRREYENTVQKLNSNMNSIKTFWSPELKKERSMRKEESARSVMIHEQLRVVSQEAQRQAQVIRQLQTELQCQYELSRTIRDTEMHSVSKEQYEAIRLEKERLHRELTLSKETLRDVEIQIESQRQTLASKDESIKKLLDMLQAKGTFTYSAAQDRLELEQSRGRQIELESRCRRYEATLQQKDQDVRALRDECVAAAEKLRHTQNQFSDYAHLGSSSHRGDTSSRLNPDLEATALRSLVDTKQSRIQQLEQLVGAYETEISHLRELKGRLGGNPRESSYLGEKSVTDREYQEIKAKVEKMEIELKQKQAELQTNHARSVTAEEQAGDMRKRIDLMKDSMTAKEQQISLMQADVKALRGKLDARNETIEQKTQQLQQAQIEKNRHQNDLADLQEQLKIRDGKVNSLQRKIDSLEDMIKERDNQLDVLKQKLAAPQSSTQHQKFQEQLDELNRERDRLLQQMRDQSDRIESERLEELDVHRREVRDLRMAIESLQKDITDRQVLIESQHEKISDLNREVTSVRSDVQIQAARQADGDFYVNEFERLNRDLQETRGEVERLLKMVSSLEKEKEELNIQIRMLERQIEESQTRYSTTIERKIVPSTAAPDMPQDPKLAWDQQMRLRQKEQRVEELEEALKESVNISTEREMAMAQQKQTTQQLEAKMIQYRDQMCKLQQQYDELGGKLSLLNQDKQDKDSLIRSLKHERRKHIEEVLQLKEEALLAAISEKDAHIALLETSQTKNPEEVEGLRRHKEKLIRKLKDENARRIKLFNDMKETSGTNAAALSSASSPARPMTVEAASIGSISSSLAKDLKFSPVDQIVQSIRFVELQKKKLRVFIDQLLACILDFDPELLTGLPRTQQSSGVDIKLLKKLTHEQLLLELQQRDTDSLQLQRYATQLMQRLATVQPTLVRRAMRLLDSFNGHPSTSEAFFYERLSRHYQKKRHQQQQKSVSPIVLPPPPSSQQSKRSPQKSHGSMVVAKSTTICLQSLVR